MSSLSDFAVIVPSGIGYGISVCDLGMLVDALTDDLPIDEAIEHSAFDGTINLSADRVGKEIIQQIARLKQMYAGGDYWAEPPEEEVVASAE